MTFLNFSVDKNLLKKTNISFGKTDYEYREIKIKKSVCVHNRLKFLHPFLTFTSNSKDPKDDRKERKT